MIVHFNVGKGKALNKIDVSTFTFAPLENRPNVLYSSIANLNYGKNDYYAQKCRIFILYRLYPKVSFEQC